MKKVFLLHAPAQSGKNTCADIMKTELENAGERVIIIAFADYVKFTLEKYYGISDFKSKEGRSNIQNYATEKIRNRYDRNFWANIVSNYLDAIRNDFDIAIIPDWRFNNEIESMKWHFGNRVIAVSITRPDVKNIDNMTEEQRRHQSESELNDYKNFDYNIINEYGKLEETKKQIIKIIEKENKLFEGD